MSLFEALIIYLSVGAPFGVLLFFANRRSIQTAIVYSILATVGWPVVAGQRAYRSLGRGRDREQARGEVNELEVLHCLVEEVPTATAKLFEIAGHPNPWLATNCYTRSRKNVVRSHIDRLGTASSSNVEELQITALPEYTTIATSVVSSRLEFRGDRS